MNGLGFKRIAGSSAILKRAAALALVSAVLWFGHLGIALPLLAYVVVIRALPITWSLSVRLSISLPLWLSWLIVVTTVLQQIGFGLNPALTWAPLIVCLGARSDWQLRRAWPQRTTLADLVPWIVAACLLLFLASAAVLHVGNGGRGITQRLSLMAGPEDGASHYAIYDAVLRIGGIPYGHAGEQYSAQLTYPPAFHVAAAALERGMEHTVGTNPYRGGRFDSFWLASLLALGLLAATAGTLASCYARQTGIGDLLTAFVAGAVTLGMVLWIPFGIFSTGFMGQLLAMSVFLTIPTLAFVSSHVKYRTAVASLSAALIMTTWTWYFLTPVAAVYALIWLWCNRSSIMRFLGVTAICAAVTVLASAPPLIRGASAGSLSAVNAGGGVAPFSFALVVGICMLAVASAIVLPKEWKEQRLVALVTVSVPMLFSLGLREYQLHTIGYTAYFFQKSLYTSLIVGIAIALPGIAILLFRADRVRHTAAAVLVVLSGAWIVGATAVAPDAWHYRNSGMSSMHRATFARYLDEGDRLEGRYVVVWGVADSPLHDYLGTRWVSSLNGRTNADFWSLMYKIVQVEDEPALAQFINDHPDEVTVITRDPELRTRLLKEGVLSSSIDPESVVML